MGQPLGLKVVAEGVETEEQIQILKRSVCRVVRGFLTGSPVPTSEIDEVASTSWSPTSARHRIMPNPIAGL